MCNTLWEAWGSGGIESCGFLLMFGGKFSFAGAVLRGDVHGCSPCLGSAVSCSRCVCTRDVFYGRDAVTGLDWVVVVVWWLLWMQHCLVIHRLSNNWNQYC